MLQVKTHDLYIGCEWTYLLMENGNWHIQTSSRGLLFKANNNSVRPGFNFLKESRNQNFTPKTSWINLRGNPKLIEHLKEKHLKEPLKEINTKARKDTVASRKLQKIISKKSPLTIYISFIRSYLNYGDIIYCQPNNCSFCHKIESIQYKVALA